LKRYFLHEQAVLEGLPLAHPDQANRTHCSACVTNKSPSAMPTKPAGTDLASCFAVFTTIADPAVIAPPSQSIYIRDRPAATGTPDGSMACRYTEPAATVVSEAFRVTGKYTTGSVGGKKTFQYFSHFIIPT